MENKYHPGEIHLQEQFGESNIATKVVRMIKNKVIGGAIPFLEKQAFIVVSSQDTNGKVWSSLLIGQSGWIDASVESKITIALKKMISPESDIFFENIRTHASIGIIFIELGTRRRYRINGRVERSEGKLLVQIEEAYPNCPKYIERRVLTSMSQSPTLQTHVTNGNALDLSQKEWIAKSDTFFVSSISNNGSMDASHRGGKKGFIEILEDGTLKIPDYKGNSMFNTLGNLYENPEAGLIFLDFENGSILQLTGRTTFLFDQLSSEDQRKTTETGRYWLFKTEAWIQTNQHHDIAWEFLDSSPFNQF